MEAKIDEHCLKRHSRGGDEDALASWAHLTVLARETERDGDVRLAEEFLRSALWIADEFLSAEAAVEALVEYSGNLIRQKRVDEANAAFVRALKLFEENTNN
ncbi:MAG TPA: hypothetical protein V6D17_16715 [Candidatus Obscuribacterales bacterium]